MNISLWNTSKLFFDFLNMENFIQWTLSNGGYIHPSVEFKEDGYSGIGAFATDDITAGTKFVGIPHHLSMNIFSVLADQDFRSALGVNGIRLLNADSNGYCLINFVSSNCHQTYPALSGQELLTLAIIYYKQTTQSFWNIYCSSIPSELSSPLAISDYDLDMELGGTGLDVVIRARLGTLKKQYKLLKKAFVNLEFKLNWKDYLWSNCIQLSRAFKFMEPDDPDFFNEWLLKSKLNIMNSLHCSLLLLIIFYFYTA